MEHLRLPFLRNENVAKKDKTKEHRKENNYGLLNFYGSFSKFIINCKVRILSLIGSIYLQRKYLFIINTFS